MTRNSLLAGMLGALCVVVVLSPDPTQAAEESDGPPIRPKVFRTTKELRDYLKALNEYFSIVGRPRFGKRTLEDTYDKRADYMQFDLDGNGSVSDNERDYLRYLLYGYRK